MSTSKAIILAGALVALTIYLVAPSRAPVASLADCIGAFDPKERMPRACRTWEPRIRKAHEAQLAAEAERRKAEVREKADCERTAARLKAYEATQEYKDAMAKNYAKYGRPSALELASSTSCSYLQAKYFTALMGIDIETRGAIPPPLGSSNEAKTDLEKEREKNRKLAPPYRSPGPSAEPPVGRVHK